MKPLFKLYTLILLSLFALIFSPIVRAEDDKFSQDELNEILGPVALYPDPLLAQILPAATYPLEVVDAARLIKDESDFDKIDNQDWDPSVKAIARYPSVLKTMSDDLKWTQKLGQAFLDQQEEVMATVQDLRQKAQDNGHLKTNKQQVVKIVEKQIEIVPAEPEVIYVPVYSPRIVYYRPWWYYPDPVITFGIGWHIGSWLDIGFYWPHRHVYYCGPRYWYGGYYVRHPHAYYSRTTVVNNVTNVYYAGKNTRTVGNRWTHNVRHGNPYNGRVLKNAQSLNSTKAVTLKSGRTQNVTRKLSSGDVKQSQDSNVKSFQNNLKKVSSKSIGNKPRISTKDSASNSNSNKVSVSKSKSGSNSNSVSTSTKTRKSTQHVSTSASGSSKPTSIKYSTSKDRSSNSVSHSSFSKPSSSSSKIRTSSTKVSSQRPKPSNR